MRVVRLTVGAITGGGAAAVRVHRLVTPSVEVLGMDGMHAGHLCRRLVVSRHELGPHRAHDEESDECCQPPAFLVGQRQDNCQDDGIEDATACVVSGVLDHGAEAFVL